MIREILITNLFLLEIVGIFEFSIMNRFSIDGFGCVIQIPFFPKDLDL